MTTRGWHSIYPLLSFNDPRDVIAAQPTFFCCEVLFLTLAVVGLVDAAKRPRGLLTFVACFVGGAGVELVTILHGEVLFYTGIEPVTCCHLLMARLWVPDRSAKLSSCL